MISLKASTLFLFMGAFSVGLTAQTAPATVKTTTTKTTTTTTVKAKAATAAKPATQTVTTKTTTTVAKKMPVKSTSTKTAPKATNTVKKTTTATSAPKTSTSSTTAVTTTTPTQNTGGSIKTQTTLPNVNQAPGEQKTVGNKTSTTTPATTGSTGTTTQSSGKIGTGSSTTTTNTNTTTSSTGDILSTITQGDASDAIKAALKLGVQAGVDKVSITDGFFGNSMIKIPFPSQVGQVESTLRSVGMGSLVDNAVKSMNRAAESAAKQAGPIFLNSITQMTVTDAVNIVGNQQPDAATQFLKRTTTESLVSSFKPSIKTALDATLATKYWGDITGYYNKIPFVSPVNTDLPDYVTRKAIDGLFYMVAQEEAKIRKDPAGSASKVVTDVFEKVKNKF